MFSDLFLQLREGKLEVDLLLAEELVDGLELSIDLSEKLFLEVFVYIHHHLLRMQHLCNAVGATVTSLEGPGTS